MSKQFAAVLAAIVLLFVIIFAIAGHKDSKTSGSKSSSATLTNHIEGSKSTGVILVEYGDYECPYCEQFAPTVQAVVAEFKDQIQFQFRNFPLVNVHQNAFAGARAAEAAGLEGKFWEMHDQLYDQGNWQVWSTANDPTPFFKQFAQHIGLNATTFATDFASSKVNDLINADMSEGSRLKIQGTPAFFLDGKAVTINNTVAAFEKVIKAEIAKKAPAATPPTSSDSTAAPAPDAMTPATN